MSKLTKKKKLAIAISAVLVVAIVGTTTGVALAQKAKGLEVQFHTVGTQDVSSSINATATVEAGGVKEYKGALLTKVNEVFVKVGDKVVEGQRLVSFDTASLDQQLAELQKQYQQSNASYKDSLKLVEQAKKQIATMDTRIAQLEAIIADAITASTTQAPTQPTIPDMGLPQDVLDKLQGALNNSIATGNVSSEAIQKAMKDILDAELAKGTITQEQYQNLMKTPELGADLSAMSAQMELATLKMQRQIQEMNIGTNLTNTTNTLMKTTANAISSLRAQRDELAKGWTADFSGLITEVNVTPNADIPLLKAGIVLSGTDVLTAVITLGKYDIQKVSVGMPCKVSVVKGSYDGEVAFIAPTATGNSGTSSILDSVSSSMGISGLSSLSGGKDGLRCEVTIHEPDEKVIIGLDANVEIDLETKKDVVAIPVECLKSDKESKYVFVYDQSGKKVEKRAITVGTNSDLYYEVISGLKKGDKIASSELSVLKDGDRVTISNKTPTKK